MSRDGTVSPVDKSEVVLECIALTKRFGGLTAVDSMSMDLRRGEVLALVGDNGAGKSTMVQMISGEYHPDGGSIVLDGQPVSFSTPMDARQMGIETIYQDLALCENLDAAGNIFLGQELRTRRLGLLPSLDRQTMRAESREVLRELDIAIPDLRRPIRQLSGGQRQAVAISRAVYWKARLMIMDEPTAALGVPEQRRVFDLVRTLRDQGVPVLIISHNIQDVMQISDRIVVMRRGLKVGELVTRDTDLNEVVSLIVGGPGGEPTTAPAAPTERGASTVNRMSERSETRQAESLSTAELRAYRQLCDGSGRMLVIACDQRNAMRSVLAATPNDRAAISNAQLGEVKADLVRHLGNRAPSVLLDPECALPRIVDEDVLGRDVGLLVAMDASGWQTKPDSPMRYSAVIPGIDADAVRALGGTAAKMLVYMRPDLEDQDAHAVGLIRDLVADCRANDLLLVVEILTYQLEDEPDAEYEEKKPDLIRDAAALSISAGAKVLKLQYPGSAAACRAVTEAAAGAPWAMLSAGVDHATFLDQLRVALANGASGAIAGRSLWKDAVSLDPVERADRLERLALPRLREVQALIGEVPT